MIITEELIAKAIRRYACDTGVALARALIGSPVAWLRPRDIRWLSANGLTPKIDPIDPPPEVLIRLASEPDLYVRETVARRACPTEVLALLAGDAELHVRVAVAQHPLCPAEALARLAGDEVVDVRESAAQHPLCPVEVLVRLAGDGDWRVRVAVAQHHACPPKILIHLARDEDEAVRRPAVNRLKCIATR